MSKGGKKDLEALNEIAQSIKQLMSDTIPVCEGALSRIVGGEVVIDVDWNSFRSGPVVNQTKAIQTLSNGGSKYVCKRIEQVFQEGSIDDQARKVILKHVGEIKIKNLKTDNPAKRQGRLRNGVLIYEGVFAAGIGGCLNLTQIRNLIEKGTGLVWDAPEVGEKEEEEVGKKLDDLESKNPRLNQPKRAGGPAGRKPPTRKGGAGAAPSPAPPSPALAPAPSGPLVTVKHSPKSSSPVGSPRGDNLLSKLTGKLKRTTAFPRDGSSNGTKAATGGGSGAKTSGGTLRMARLKTLEPEAAAPHPHPPAPAPDEHDERPRPPKLGGPGVAGGIRVLPPQAGESFLMVAAERENKASTIRKLRQEEETKIMDELEARIQLERERQAIIELKEYEEIEELKKRMQRPREQEDAKTEAWMKEEQANLFAQHERQRDEFSAKCSERLDNLKRMLEEKQTKKTLRLSHGPAHLKSNRREEIRVEMESISVVVEKRKELIRQMAEALKAKLLDLQRNQEAYPPEVRAQLEYERMQDKADIERAYGELKNMKASHETLRLELEAIKDDPAGLPTPLASVFDDDEEEYTIMELQKEIELWTASFDSEEVELITKMRGEMEALEEVHRRQLFEIAQSREKEDEIAAQDIRERLQLQLMDQQDRIMELERKHEDLAKKLSEGGAPVSSSSPGLTSVSSSSFIGFSGGGNPGPPTAPRNIVREVFKEGFLTKRGDSVKTWKRRWCVLKGKTVKYYISKEAAREQPDFPQGTIANIKRCVTCQIDREHSFIIHTDNRQFFCCAESEGEMRDWMDKVNEVANQAKSSMTKAELPHAWSKTQNFDMPVRCASCTSFIWGVAKHGFYCKTCECAVHKECMKEMNNDCSGAPPTKLAGSLK
eukprot:TRINITY_DN5097_c0_g1_i1.p1 TRINITY_DN5097_c0_g1~~TRINITY_DN5097_c0_g1_i1.p1  ORF type:complete len:883 (+),score=275.94 TRINITY_DN5097_c0_g1_i1:174-2822(+)